MSEYRCPNCQTELNTTSQFCRRCGFKVSAPLVNASVGQSVTEATTRNLPNPPQMQDFRQTNNFSNPPFGQTPPPAGYQQQTGQQMRYMAVTPPPPRRSNGPKVLLISFIAFAFMAFCMIFVMVGPLRHARKPANISRPSIPVSGTSYVKTFKLPSDGQISLASMSGKIEVTTYDGDTVEFKALRGDGSNVSMDEALDMTLIGNTFSAKYRGGRNANLSYEIKIPRKMGAISLSSVSGDIKIEGLEGNIKAESTSGEIELQDVAGSVDLRTVSGDQSVSFKNPPTGDLKFNSVSGDISLTFPVEPDLKAAFGSTTGDVDSVYPVTKNSRPASTTASGVWGKGLYNLIVHTVSGDLEIKR